MRKLIVGTFILFSAAQLGAQSVVTSIQQNGTTQSAEYLSAPVSLNVTSMRVRDALLEIGKQASLKIVFGDAVANDPGVVTLQVHQVPASKAIATVISGRGIFYRTTASGQILFEKRGAKSTAQGVVTGKVTDAKSGKGLSGANVLVDADSRGVTTDEDGSYRINGISSGTHTIIARLVGYAKQTRSITVGNGATVTADFKLEPSANVLNDVIVTGTVTSTELKAVPNAITVITAKQIEERGITHIDQLFRGDIPGLFSVEMGSGSLTGNPSLGEVFMFSRGATTITTTGGISGSAGTNKGTNPIKTYVDGVELVNSQYLSQIDPRSIERIEILTGPQASTIYGANAINGVMQIFTKRGNTVRPSVTFSGSEGFTQNNLSSALAPSRTYDGSVSAVAGKISYNAGSSWNYMGAWTPGNQTQVTSVYGGSRYQSDVFSWDVSAREGWTKNKAQGNVTQGVTTEYETGRLVRGSTNFGLVTRTKNSLFGRTFGFGVTYTPVSWWSHQFRVGTDASDTESLSLNAGFARTNDTAMSNSQSPNSNLTQSYSSTLRIPILSLVQATLTYGADHLRSRASSVSWTRNLDGSFSSPATSRPLATTAKNMGAYIQGQFGFWDALFLTSSIRADWNPNYGDKAKVRPGNYGAAFSRDFGIVSAKLRGSYGRSIRPPSAGQKLGSKTEPVNQFNVPIIAWYVPTGSPLYEILPTPDLGPEFQQGGEGGIELYIGNRGSLVVTRYNQTVDRLITTLANFDSIRALQPGVPNPTNFSCTSVSNLRSDGYCYWVQNKVVNAGSIRNQGWEMHGTLNTGPFTTSGTYSWTKSRVIGVTQRYRALLIDQNFISGQTFNWVAEHTWALNVSYAHQGTSVSFYVNGLGQTFRRATDSYLGPVTTTDLRLRAQETYRMVPFGDFIRLPASGYATADMAAAHRFSSKLDATLNVANLTNYYHNDIYWGYATRGRSSRVGFRWRWQ